ncbi:MAG: hypothetical protein ACK40X_11650 [Armatimonadota bacterium]
MDVKAKVVGVAVYLLPIKMRMPLKFGREVVNDVVCCRVRLKVTDEKGRFAEGWGETPLIAQWGWASENLSYSERLDTMRDFCLRLAKAWTEFDETGHADGGGSSWVAWRANSLLRCCA